MKSSVFIRIDRYRELADTIKQIKAKVDDAKQLLRKIKDIKSQEDSELEAWQNEMEAVEKKLAAISEAMSER